MLSDDLVVVVLDELVLQHSEQFLVGAGEGQAVIDVRGRYQQAIETTFRAAVERATGRRVVSFASVTNSTRTTSSRSSGSARATTRHAAVTALGTAIREWAHDSDARRGGEGVGVAAGAGGKRLLGGCSHLDADGSSDVALHRARTDQSAHHAETGGSYWAEVESERT